MTLDELLQQLMKIKECYPDSGKFLIAADLDYLDKDVLINRIRVVGQQVLVED